MCVVCVWCVYVYVCVNILSLGKQGSNIQATECSSILATCDQSRIPTVSFVDYIIITSFVWIPIGQFENGDAGGEAEDERGGW